MMLIGFTDPYKKVYSESYDESYPKVIRGNKYNDKDNDKDNDKNKDTDKVPEKPNICYILEILMTHSKYDDRYLNLVIVFTPVTLVTLFWSYNQFYRAERITVLGFFLTKSKLWD